MTTKKPFRVLTLDGGGMRGLYTAALLYAIVRAEHKHGDKDIDIGKGFDLIVGTSTGGILATGLMYGCSIITIMSVYAKHGDAIFKKPAKSKIKLLRELGNLTRKAAKEREKALRDALDEQFKDTTIKQAWDNRKIALCLTATNTANQKPTVFKTPHISSKNRDDDCKLVEACLATSALPVFFPLAVVSGGNQGSIYNTFADGGLWANNPALIGLIEALEVTNDKRDIQIISVGTAAPSTGQITRKEDANIPFIGEGGWKGGVGVFEAMLESQSSSIEFMLSFILRHLKANVEYIRIGNDKPPKEFEKHIGTTKADKDAILTLKTLAENDVQHKIFGVSSQLSNSKIGLIKEIINDMPEMATT